MKSLWSNLMLIGVFQLLAAHHLMAEKCPKSCAGQGCTFGGTRGAGYCKSTDNGGCSCLKATAMPSGIPVPGEPPVVMPPMETFSPNSGTTPPPTGAPLPH